jgi:leucyl-tRNA synthetase
VLHDLGYIGFEEPYKRLVNQGMIQGSSRFVYRMNGAGIERLFISFLEANFNEYHFVTGDFDEPQIFDFKGNFNGKKYGIEISSFHNSKSEIKKHISTDLEKEDIITISITNSEFIWYLYYGDAKKWLGEILKNETNYNSQLKENFLLLISKNVAKEWDEFHYDRIHVDVNLVDGIELDIDAFRKSKPEYANAFFILEDGKVLSPGEDLGEVSSKYICGVEVEKMSKSKFNTVNPNMLVEKYGADTFRMYEMFLGPVDQSKPWDTKGIEGVHRFLKKLWRLFYDDVKDKAWNDEKANDADLKVLHKTIKKVEEDTERFSYNTAVSAFMVCVNELTDLKCHKKEILQPLLILLAPYAPHIAEELYHALGNNSTIIDAAYPELEKKYLIESEKEYPISINGKMRTTITISLDASEAEVERIALDNEIVQKWLEGRSPKKIIFVKNKMVNIVV